MPNLMDKRKTLDKSIKLLETHIELAQKQTKSYMFPLIAKEIFNLIHILLNHKIL